jgi:hypothetical protein
MPGTLNTKIYQERKEAGLCTRCGAPAADGSQFCEVHLDADRAYKKKYARKMRRRHQRAKVCLECGATRRKGDKLCLKCRVRRNRLSVVALPGVENRVEKSDRIAAMTATHADGRTRYHGQGRRGQQPRAQLNAQDLGFARAALAAGEAGLQMLDTPEVRALPRIQREDVKHAALHQLGRAIGHIEDVQERMGHFRAPREPGGEE